MKSKILAVILFATLFVSTSAYCKVNLFYPPNNTMFDKDTITISGTSDETITQNQSIKIEGTGVYETKFRDIKFTFSKENTFNIEAHLYPGLNKIIYGDIVANVFFDDKTEDVPYNFKKLFIHSEPDCGNCHKMSPAFSVELSAPSVNEVCGECHDKVEGKANLHQGFADSTCIDCHNPHFSEFESHLQKNQDKLCYDCHDNVTEIKGADFVIVHAPVERGECSKCHDPHASDNEKLLKKKKYDLCTSCHSEPAEFGHANEYDDCTMCHNHHAGKQFILLKDKYWENCLDCHDNVAQQKFRHNPPDRGCGDCHNPHSETDLKDVMTGCRACHKPEEKEFARFHGGLILPVEKCFTCHAPHDAYNSRLLRSKLHFPLTQAGNCVACHEMQKGKKRETLGFKMEKSEICFKCHGDKKPLVGYDRSVHPPVLYGDCVQCHSPHLKLKLKQLLLPLELLCYKCHDNFVEKVKSYEKGTIHPPVEEGDCLACHDPHQSENVALLETKLNGLCFQCHDAKTSIIEGRTLEHYHEPPTDDLCTKCHSPHISKGPNLLKEEIK